MGQVIRRAEIRRRRTRKAKVAALRTRYQATTSKTDKQAIMTKLAKVAPWLSEEQFVAPIKK
jgi:hypothetical protein